MTFPTTTKEMGKDLKRVKGIGCIPQSLKSAVEKKVGGNKKGDRKQIIKEGKRDNGMATFIVPGARNSGILLLHGRFWLLYRCNRC